MTPLRRLEPVLPYAAALVAAALPTYLLRFSVFGVPTTALELFIYVFVALVIFSQWGYFRLPPRAILWPVVLFLLSAAISAAIAPDKEAALGILKSWIIAPMLFAWALYQLRERHEALTPVIIGLVAGGIFVALVAIGQRLAGEVTPDGRVLGPYGWFPAENASPNYLALYLAPIGVLAAGLASMEWSKLKAKTKDQRSFAYLSLLVISFLLIALATFFSLSRAGLAALAIGTGLIPVMRYWPWIRVRLWAKFALILLTALLLITGWFFIRPNPALSPEEGGRITASNNVRWEIWRTTVGEVLSNQSSALPGWAGSLPNWVAGVGLGNFQNYFTNLTVGRVNYDRIAPLALTPHNFFLALWVNFGLLGLLAAGWLLIVVFIKGFKRITGLAPSAYSLPLIPLLAAMVALLAHGLLDTPYFKNDLSVLFWTLMALVVLLSQPESGRAQ